MVDNPELFEVKQKWDRSGLDISYFLSQTAKDSKNVVAFNYASLLLNNSYFLEGLVSLASHLGRGAELMALARRSRAKRDPIILQIARRPSRSLRRGYGRRWMVMGMLPSYLCLVPNSR